MSNDSYSVEFMGKSYCAGFVRRDKTAINNVQCALYTLQECIEEGGAATDLDILVGVVQAQWHKAFGDSSYVDRMSYCLVEVLEAGGWFDRCADNGSFYLGRQVKESDILAILDDESDEYKSLVSGIYRKAVKYYGKDCWGMHRVTQCHFTGIRWLVAAPDRVKFCTGLIIEDNNEVGGKLTLTTWEHSWLEIDGVIVDPTIPVKKARYMRDVARVKFTEIDGEWLKANGITTTSMKKKFVKAFVEHFQHDEIFNDLTEDKGSIIEQFRRDAVDAIWTEAHRLARAA